MKPSEMIMQCASGFIAMGKSIEEKQNLLNAACTAWNISLLPKDKREAALQRCIKDYKRFNPGVDENDCANHENNLNLLIERKLELFPKVNRQIVGAEIRNVDGKDTVTVTSIDMDQFK